MSIRLPSRRVLETAPTILKTIRPTLLTPTLTLLRSQTRSASKNSRLSDTAKSMTGRNKPKDLRKSALGNIEDRESVEQAFRKRIASTVMESQSIFDEDLKKMPEQEMDEQGRMIPSSRSAKLNELRSVMGASLVPHHVRHAVDPDPKSRRRWERKMVIRNVTRALDVRGKETRDERIKRTEREVLSKSTWFATSTKKLVHLARQVSGKTLEDARIQMKFSKKKFAKEVLYELDLARDKAVVERGMGLGTVNGEFKPGEADLTKVRDVRHGKWVEIDDPTRLYVHEAWVNRGPWRGKRPNYRARGRTDLIKMPQASITIRLKEEKSRLRESDERAAKEAKRGPWIQLPNRPVTAQRPFYSW